MMWHRPAVMRNEESSVNSRVRKHLLVIEALEPRFRGSSKVDTRLAPYQTSDNIFVEVGVSLKPKLQDGFVGS